MYSTVDYLLAVRDALTGTPEWEKLLGSAFGGLYRIPARRLLMGRVVHGMMTRQVVTKKKYEMWPVFGGKPFRFSLVEFGEVTGLPCGEFEEGYSIDYQLPPKGKNYDYWERLIGCNRDVTIEDLVAMVETEKEMPGWRKFRLCLLIIVDGVLVATTQKPRPSLKYVKMVEDLKKFLAFPWGRESFLWTMSTLKPAPKVMGKCENPTGDFCKKLRQKTVKTVGFPLALQLVAYQAIPQLLKQVGGDDNTTLVDYRGKVLPQHAGLVSADIQRAEHDTGRFDKKVDYMVKLLKEGHIFTKAHWDGGDAGDPLYVYSEKEINRKRKTKGAVVGGESLVLKQRRVSAYFKRGAFVDDEKYAKMEARVEELGEEVARLKGIVEKQERQMKKLKKIRKGKSGSKRRKSLKKTEKEGIGRTHEGVEFEPAVYGDEWQTGVENVTAGIGEDSTPQETKGASPEEGRVMLARLKDGNGDPSQWVEGGNTGAGDKVLYEGVTSNTYFVTEDEVRENVYPLSYVDQSGTVGDECDGPIGYGLKLEVSMEVVVERAVDAAEKDENLREETEKMETGGEADGNEDIGSGDDLTDEEGVKPDVESGVLDVSDSPITTAERHRPVEQEEELAAVLLTKDQFQIPDVVPIYEDCDFPFFERVLKANIHVMHYDAGGYDLDNRFFVELAKKQHWVSSTHMAVLMEYIERMHYFEVQQNRAAFVAPWFTAHVQGKARAFKAAKLKTRVAGQASITKYLTKEGKRWGVDVDILYAPMIWEGYHWVGLCISLVDWSILVMDPNPQLKAMEEVAALMEPVATMLPYIAKKVCPAGAVGEHQLVPFHVERLEGVYVNGRSGDCGPVAVKFMEMHATGNKNPTMAGLTDDLVDNFRKQYAMEIYRRLIVPLYLG
ncbi:hypothetical protein N665_0789s0001 [Sinapis alba]|nr:hypothetical protein N665_0789s0001 [Sinapis alba]